MELAEKKEMLPEDIGRVADFFKKNNHNEIRLMGGEPTLHPQFKEIIERVLSSGLNIKLFTNGIFPKELAHWLAKKEKAISYSINLSTPTFQEKISRMALADNLKILKRGLEISAAVTIDSLDFCDEQVINFIEENGIKSTRIGIANILIGDPNWLMNERYKDFGLIISLLVNRLKQAGVLKISLNCGFTPCMFDKKIIERFLKDGVLIRGWGCKGKKGSFDISADLSVSPCFVLEDLKIKNILDFKNLEAVDKFMDNLVRYTVRASSLFIPEPCRKCSHYKIFECSGPCLGSVVNNNQKRALENFQKTFHFRFIRDLLYFCRNWI